MRFGKMLIRRFQFFAVRQIHGATNGSVISKTECF